jgi:hypothetical protein
MPMNSRGFVVALAMLALLAAPMSAAREPPGAVAPNAAARHRAIDCEWNADIARDWVRSPVQMDIHAGYRIFVFHTDGTIGYRLRGEFPYAAFLSFTIYDGTLLYAALTDYQIEPDPGSANPFDQDEFVHARDRSYTVTVLPDGAVPAGSPRNPMIMPPLPPGTTEKTIVLAQRIYLAEPQVDDRFGGVDAPTIEPFVVSTGKPAACPRGDFKAVVGQFGRVGGNFSQSPLPRDGKIEFYRPPASMVPFADGSSRLTETDCTSYLMATVFPDQIAVVNVPTLPGFFDNTHIKKRTRFDVPEVRYVSIGSYGATPLGEREDENIAGPDIATVGDGATFVAVPIRILRFHPEEAKKLRKTVDKLGYNLLPLGEYGPLFPLDVKGPWIDPFLIYRNKVPAAEFPGSIQNVPCYDGTDFGSASSDYAASYENMDEYAPTGVECSVDDFLYGDCGHEFSRRRR